MKTSDSLAKITEGLVEAHKKITHASKDKTNPHFKSKYATLESVIDATRDSLLEQSIVVLQLVGHDSVITRLQHSSGEFIETDTKIYLKSTDMQALGSSISYARRYALAAILNISQTDDDGNAGSATHKQEPPKQQEPQKPKSNAENIADFAKTLGYEDMKLKELIIKKYGKPVDFNAADKNDCRLFCEFLKTEKEKEGKNAI